MQFAVSYQNANLSHPNIPSVPSYKELLETRQRRLEQRTKSAGTLTLLKTLEPSASMPKLSQIKPKYQQPAIIKKLNYDFGSLKEFLNYDLKLKRPEDLFKMTDKERRVEVKNKEEDLKKGLMQHVRQEVDTRTPKTILIEEKDPEKVSKAAKRFVSDMVTEIFQEDLNVLERRMIQKGVTRIYELLADLDDDDPVRKIAEKYGYKTLADKFSILEVEMEKKKTATETYTFANTKKARGAGLPNKMILQGSNLGTFGDQISPLDKPPSSHKVLVPLLPKQNQVFRARQNSYNLSVNRAIAEKPYVFIDEGQTAFVPRKDNRSMSPKFKKKEASDQERMSYAIRLIKGSGSLEQMYVEYDKSDKEQYNKEIKQAEETAKLNYKDYYGLKDNEKMAAITKNHIVFTYSELKSHFFMHTFFQFQTFSSLWILNLRGCELQENIVWLMLKLVERYSPDIRMIDISENQASNRICEVVKDILVKSELKVLKMAGMGLKSKGLAVVCLGLAENTTVTDLDFNYNEIDESGFKTLALILRHSKALQTVKILRKKKFVVLPTGEEKFEEEELGYQAMAAISKAFKHNRHLNPKNVLLFEPKLA